MMKDIEHVLKNLDTPEITLPSSEKYLKKAVLYSFKNSSKKFFLRGGEYMEFLKEHLSRRIIAGFFVVLFAAAFFARFGMQNTEKANAQELVQNALKKVSLLSAEEQKSISDEKKRLEQAEKASDLRVISTVNNKKTLKFTDDNGQEETIELENEEVVRPSLTPSTSPAVMVSPTVGISGAPAVTATRQSVSRSREEERESVSAEKNERENSVSGSNGGSTQSVQKESEGGEKKDD